MKITTSWDHSLVKSITQRLTLEFWVNIHRPFAALIREAEHSEGFIFFLSLRGRKEKTPCPSGQILSSAFRSDIQLAVATFIKGYQLSHHMKRSF